MDFETKDSGQREEFSSGARRDLRVGKGRYDLLQYRALGRVAKVAERGAEKYGDENWRLGIPPKRFQDSAMRHLCQYGAGNRDEDHLGQAVWNLLCIIEMQEIEDEQRITQAEREEFWEACDSVQRN